MPNLMLNNNPSIDSLRLYLVSILPDASITDVTVDSTLQPILLLQTKNVIAAFAFSGADVHNSFEALYGGFKAYYMKQQGKWDSLDLSFVFCVQPDIPNIDQFCSKVETNVYFCRKYVVLLVPQLAESLARLPFLPLIPLGSQSMRPASAQTFLQQCTMPALLAKYIVVQRERSPEGIIEDCLNGKFGEPRELIPTKKPWRGQPERNIDPVRLETIAIKNFRAYRKLQTFELGSDVTLLYGPNGFGKTSFFDAVDFAITGGLGRFNSSNEAHFAKTAQHLDSNSEESFVSVSFIRNGSEHKVSRSVGERKHALLDGQTTDRKSILNELTSGSIPAADRVENFVNLFRATHLFSQEQQELTRGFQNDCQLPAPTVSRMLAFEDYVNAINKAEKVRDVLQAEITSATREIHELTKQIIDEKKELDRLGQTATAHINKAALDAEIEALRAKIDALGISASAQKADTTILRGWRASLEARHAESRSLIERFSSLSEEIAGLHRLHTELASVQNQITQKEQEFRVSEKNMSDAESALQLAELRLAEMKVKRSEIQERGELLQWVRETKPVYVQLVSKQHTLAEELDRATADLEKHRIVERKKAGELLAIENLAALSSDKLKTKQAELASVLELNKSISSWQENQIRLTSLVVSDQSSAKDLELLRAEEREFSLQLAMVDTEKARVSRKIAEVDKNQSEIKNLLSQIQLHIHSSTCPLCGEDHDSREELVRRIHKQVEIDAASEARTELAELSALMKQLHEQLAGNRHKQNAANTRLAELKKERAELEAKIGEFINSAAIIGVLLDGSDQTLKEQLDELINKAKQDADDLIRNVQDTGIAEKEARTALAETKTLVSQKAAMITEKETRLAHLKNEVSRLHNDPRLIEVSFEIDDKELAHIEQLNSDQLVRINEKIAEVQTTAARNKEKIGTFHQESTSIKAHIHTLTINFVNLQKTLTKINARLEESKLPADTDEEMLIAIIAKESNRQAQILSLRDTAANLELALDVATTAAAHSQLLQKIRNKENAVMSAEKRRVKHQPWLKYFEELSRLLSTHQNEAIANFTREFGPLTSIIQRRLRSVYGFDEIEIRGHESSISVRVKRHGEELRPTDYFSQSQQQTLLLGLFLTACSAQTWSAFSTVFLDDPVTHFDDLNTYALLDLIVGLLDSDFGKRQFIISTCDEKLLQLARQKFRHLGAGAKFYRFSAIGADGPIINEITSH